MEYIDIFDENNEPIGKVKEKNQAHEDGEFHRTAHVWIINDKNELLLQKRSTSKKSHPNCWDISGAGHIRAGESVIDGAIRELREKLGVEAKEKDLKYITTIKSTKNRKNMEFQHVYLLKCNKKIDEYIFEDKEVSEVKYVYYEELEKMVENKSEGLLLHEEEFKNLFQYIRRNKKNLILAYMGTGKTELEHQYKNVIDLDFQDYKYIYDESIRQLPLEQRKGQTSLRTENPNYPDNFINAVLTELEEDKIVVSPFIGHVFKAIDSDAFKKNAKDIRIILAFPMPNNFEEYVDRFRKRGNGEEFILRRRKEFTSLVDLFNNASNEEYEKIIIKPNQYLSEALIEYGINIKER